MGFGKTANGLHDFIFVMVFSFGGDFQKIQNLVSDKFGTVSGKTKATRALGWPDFVVFFSR